LVRDAKANGGENANLYGPYCGRPCWRERNKPLIRADAQRAVIREWLALPADQRKTKEQAVAYAMRAADRFKFRYKGDRYQLIQIWLFKYLGLP
jgi:hypothetical protein